MKIDAVIFDLDGTLLDSMGIWENVDRNFLKENGVEPPEGVSDIVKKMTIQDSAMYFKERFRLSHSCEYIIDRIEEMVADEYRLHIPLKKGAYEAVMECQKKGIRMCVATATYNRLAYSALERLGILSSFDFVMTCSDVGAGKDNPLIFFKAAEKMECVPERTLVVEDSLHCIKTAKSAGFITAGVYDSVSDGDWQEIRRNCDISLENMSGLIGFL